jgi:hypothetical protein
VRPPLRRLLLVAASVVGVVAIGIAVFPNSVLYWGPPLLIEHYLKNQTPIGSTQDAVALWLQGRGNSAKINVAEIAPHSTYPPTQVGGASFIQTTVASYRIVLRADVEVFYVFDANARLADIGVRRSIDAP